MQINKVESKQENIIPFQEIFGNNYAASKFYVGAMQVLGGSSALGTYIKVTLVWQNIHEIIDVEWFFLSFVFIFPLTGGGVICHA